MGMTKTSRFASAAFIALAITACSGESTESSNPEGDNETPVEQTVEQQVASVIACDRAAEGSNVFDLTIPNDTDEMFTASVSVDMFNSDGTVVHSITVEATAGPGTTISQPVIPPQEAGPIASCEAFLS